VRAAEEKPKPNGDRLREFRDSALPSLEQQLFSTAPVYKSLETVLLADSLAEMQDALGKDNSDVQKVLEWQELPADAAKDIIAGTKLDDVAVRKQLYEGGQAAIAASNDPLIVAMRAIEPDALAARKQFDDKIDSVVRRDGTLIAKARFAQSGFSPTARCHLHAAPELWRGERLQRRMGRTFLTSRRWAAPMSTRLSTTTSLRTICRKAG
jgi:hypothetical protein